MPLREIGDLNPYLQKIYEDLQRVYFNSDDWSLKKAPTGFATQDSRFGRASHCLDPLRRVPFVPSDSSGRPSLLAARRTLTAVLQSSGKGGLEAKLHKLRQG